MQQSKVIQNKGGINIGSPYALPGYEYDPVTDKFKDLSNGKVFDSSGNAKLEDNKNVTVTENGESIITPSATYDGLKKVTLNVEVPMPTVEINKQTTIDVSTYTEPVEVTPSSGADAMTKATVTLENIPSGGATTTLYAWKISSGPDVAYTLSPNPNIGDFAFYNFNLTSKVASDCFSIWNTDGSSYITFDESTYERDSSLDITVSGPCYLEISNNAVLPAGQKLFLVDTNLREYYIDTDGEHSIRVLFDTSEFTPLYTGTMGNVHFFFAYSD